MQSQDEQADTCCICLQVLDLNILPELQQTIQQSCSNELDRVIECSNFYMASPDSCIHNFHRSCLQTWLSNNTVCPVCQQEILWINITIPQGDLKQYKQYKSEEQKIIQEQRLKKKEHEEQLVKQQKEEEDKQNESASLWDRQEINTDKNEKTRVAEHDQYPVLMNIKQGYKQKQKIQKDEFPSLQKEVEKKNEKIIDTMTDIIQSKIHGNTEIITIQQINVGSSNKRNNENNNEEFNIDGLSAYELAQLRQLELDEQNQLGIDHNFIQGELNQLQQKMDKLEDLVEWNKIDFQKFQQNYENPQDLLWFSMDSIQRKLDKYMNICVKQLPFNCQQIMYQIDLVDKEIEWGLQQKFNFIYDNYEHLYKKQKQKQQDKIIWDYQQNKVQKFGSQDIDSKKQKLHKQQVQQQSIAKQGKQNNKVKYKDNTQNHNRNINYFKKQKNIQKLINQEE